VVRLPDVPKVVRIAIQGTLENDLDVLNRFHVVYAGSAPTVDEITTFAYAIGTAWTANLKPLAWTGYNTTQITATDLTSDIASTATVPYADSGSRAGPELSASACVVLSQLIDRRYRGGHPRNYWCWGVQSDLSSPQTWSPDFVAECAAAFTPFINAVLAAAWSGAGALLAVSVGYYQNFTVVINPVTGRARNKPTLIPSPVPGPYVDLVTGYRVRPSVGSQRRRNEFVG
jgi:hypothetical protein